MMFWFFAVLNVVALLAIEAIEAGRPAYAVEIEDRRDESHESIPGRADESIAEWSRRWMSRWRQQQLMAFEDRFFGRFDPVEPATPLSQAAGSEVLDRMLHVRGLDFLIGGAESRRPGY